MNSSVHYNRPHLKMNNWANTSYQTLVTEHKEAEKNPLILCSTAVLVWNAALAAWGRMCALLASPSPPYRGKTNCYFCTKRKKKEKKGCLSPRTRLDDVHNAPLSAAAEKEGGRKKGGVDLQFLPHNNKVLSQHSNARTCTLKHTHTIISTSLIYNQIQTSAFRFKYAY